MRLIDARPEEHVYLALWEIWQDNIIEQDTREETEREVELLQAHYREAGVQEPADNSTLCLMFAAFVGGLKTALRHMAAADHTNEVRKGETV